MILESNSKNSKLKKFQLRMYRQKKHPVIQDVFFLNFCFKKF